MFGFIVRFSSTPQCERRAARDAKQELPLHLTRSGSAWNFSRLVFGQRDPGEAIVEEGRTALAHILDVMDRHLSERQYLGGDRFTLADLVWLAYVPYVQDAEADDLVSARRKVSGWWERVKDRPCVATALKKLS